MDRAASSRPNWVRHVRLRRPRPARGTGEVLVEGLLVLTGSAPDFPNPQLLVDGSPVEARWGLPSPACGRRFEDADNSAHARFRSAPVPAQAALVELIVKDATGTHITVASRALTPEGGRGYPRIEAIRARIDRALREDDRRESTYAALHRTLSRVPMADRDLRWMEAWVLADGLVRKHPNVTHRRLKDLRDQHHEAGTDGDFQAFWQEFSRVTHPYVLVRHGYRIPLAERDADEVWREVAALIERLAGLGYESFVNSGTLLGLVRDGRLIAHDDDVDLAVVLRAETLPGVVRAWNLLKAELHQVGLLRTDAAAGPRSHCKLWAADRLSVDLFPAWISGGRAYIWPHTCGDVASSDLLPLGERVVHGSTVRLPRRPEPFLECNYGPDWDRSDPAFRFDWALARRRFDSFMQEIAAQDPR
jgi:hypothetical protein